MGKKKRAGLAALGAAVALLFGVTPAWGECLVSGSDYTVGAKAAVVMEAQTGTLLFAQEAHKKLPMASTTKIMTALLTLEQEGLDETFTVDPVAIQVEGSSMGLQEGDAVVRAEVGEVGVCSPPPATTPPGPPRCGLTAARRPSSSG